MGTWVETPRPPVIKRSLSIRQKGLGRDHPDVARSLNNLADLYEKEQRFADAEPLLKRALAIREQAVGSDHPETAALVNNLASLDQEQGRIGDGLPLVERMIGPGRAQARAALPVLLDAGRQQLMPQEDLAGEAETLDKAIIAAVSRQGAKRNASAEQRSRDRLAAISAERATLQETLASEFPDYAALSNPLPMTARQVQALLSDDEALLLFALAEQESCAFALTRAGL
jgi:tetratricopeptide (TPR) repeat protein